MEDGVKMIQESLDTWISAYYFWTGMHYLIGLSSVAFAALAASKYVSDSVQPRVSLAAAISVATLTFLRPAEVAFGFDQASARTRAALIAFGAETSQPGADSNKAFQKLFDVYVAARRVVSDIQPIKLASPDRVSDEGGAPGNSQ